MIALQQAAWVQLLWGVLCANYALCQALHAVFQNVHSLTALNKEKNRTVMIETFASIPSLAGTNCTFSGKSGLPDSMGDALGSP